MNIEVYSLVLEVTRRCNMACEHCLRGDAQAVDMQKSIVDQVLRKIDSISEVTFTGGEPSLNIPIINYFMNQADKLGKLPHSFYLVTNGLENQLELATTMLKWYERMDEQELCAVAVSRDRFHAPLRRPSIVEALTFCCPDKTHGAESSDRWVIRTGRALDNGIGTQTPDSLEFSINEDNDTLYIDRLYVSANGLCTGNCDAAYEDIDDEGVPLSRLKTCLRSIKNCV